VTALATTLLMSIPADREDAQRDASAGSERRRVEELYVRLEVKLTNVLYRWLWNREEVRDVLQEAFVRLWQMRARVDWERAEPLVYRIALNLASKRRRSQRVWQFVTFADRAAEGEPADDARDEIVRRAINALPERHRRVLVMTMHSELSYDEIGEVLGISGGTVGSRRNTAVRKLRAMLARRGNDG
jgi:RNA polymerase sigma-70 factor (ECF subfamily)